MLLAVEAGAVKEGSGFLPSSRVLGRAITACAIKACAIKACAIKSCAIKASSGSCHQGECECLKQVDEPDATMPSYCHTTDRPTDRPTDQTYLQGTGRTPDLVYLQDMEQT